MIPALHANFFDTLVKPIKCYGLEILAIIGNMTDLSKLERILKRLLGVHEARSPVLAK